MDYSIRAAKLSVHYPFLHRINILLQDMGMITQHVIFFGGMNGIVNTVLTRDVVKDKINSITDPTEVSMYEALTDADLRVAIQESWHLVGEYFTGFTPQADTISGATNSATS